MLGGGGTILNFFAAGNFIDSDSWLQTIRPHHDKLNTLLSSTRLMIDKLPGLAERSGPESHQGRLLFAVAVD
ncbi:hypothetical protein CLAFUW4_04200 [Fulvia fulva]|uniref:Uncharacterized protein n=1 Tax=Passalora fulva TaxID=5499 RepID=A0A9Q8LG77_PASFU|nr:uncharacterized protein CLAFUR5_04163 [Fulvia fulva]KAK4626601.1 hypothetical protein CLAFUR4_04186 [Fulvia fulva]KAK4627415.1 hypothetical protein CLAFUR0_04186 [Fulvia fulva]UJO16818.1 hypothetical protein CLAFUR5_04163 [Fulvia fulva]WPV14304.1 hypothetical protein CLAFUW4_04200 [Fulvia fulva]WPV28392.1 hypothetical protein CLAFUW7_04189 [Fulvia fulva]